MCWGCGVGGAGHDYRGCYAIRDSRLNFSRPSDSNLLPAANAVLPKNLWSYV